MKVVTGFPDGWDGVEKREGRTTLQFWFMDQEDGVYGQEVGRA